MGWDSGLLAALPRVLIAFQIHLFRKLLQVTRCCFFILCFPLSEMPNFFGFQHCAELKLLLTCYPQTGEGREKGSESGKKGTSLGGFPSIVPNRNLSNSSSHFTHSSSQTDSKCHFQKKHWQMLVPFGISSIKG